ncbi:DUF6261 family protein [uncultured Acetobacteroides sp.]|uniref:DUF6261 family protein n=1 Tax=uncultured Acetobacteroides sp. TaxID=1760811 RepID=UPI0029F54200|nr:DUF6261 family protein [uncultured Acetobacteroides sp.]
MIDGYYFKKMHINEKGAFASEVAEATTPFKVSSPNLAAHLQEVEARLATYRKTLEKLSTVDMSSLIETDDDQRDNGLTNLRDYAQVCASRKNAEWAHAGQLIVNTYRKVGWDMDRMPYADETIRVDTLLSMLKTEPELKQAIETMKAQEWVAEIEEGQANIKAHSAARVTKEAEQEAKSNTAQAADLLGEAVAKLFRFVESEIEFYNKPELKDLVLKINTIIGRYVTLQKQRATRAKNSKDPKKDK